MVMQYKTLTGPITLPGSDIGVRAKVVAIPLTTDQALTFTGDDRITIGPVVGETSNSGALAAFKIPTNTDLGGLLWRIEAELIDRITGAPQRWTVKNAVSITGTGSAKLRDLTEIDVMVVDEATVENIANLVFDAQTARDQAVAVGSTNDTIMAGRINAAGSATDVALAAKYAARSFTKTTPATGVISWAFGTGAAGYLLHLTSTAASILSEFAIAVGTDQGAGGGALFSLKNPSGVGIRMIQNPGSAVGVYHDNYSTNLAAWHRIFNGAGAFRVDAASGAGFTDGSATSASTTFTSATAAFTAGDTGATLTITHTSAGAVVGTSFTVTYVNATTVTLSSAAGITGTGLRFTISGRVGIAAQTLIEARDTDGTTTLFKVGRGEHMFSGSSGQSTSILKVFKAGNGTPALEVDSTGKQLNKFAMDLNNAGQTGQIPLAVRNYGTGVPSVQIQGVASQGTDQLRITDVGGATQSRFDKNGYFMTRKTSVPADADLGNGELAIWLDQTAGATKAMFKAKDSAGTVRTAAVALT